MFAWLWKVVLYCFLAEGKDVFHQKTFYHWSRDWRHSCNYTVWPLFRKGLQSHHFDLSVSRSYHKSNDRTRLHASASYVWKQPAFLFDPSSITNGTNGLIMPNINIWLLLLQRMIHAFPLFVFLLRRSAGSRSDISTQQLTHIQDIFVWHISFEPFYLRLFLGRRNLPDGQRWHNRTQDSGCGQGSSGSEALIRGTEGPVFMYKEEKYQFEWA